MKKQNKKQIGYDCSCCDFARKLPTKDLEDDFVYCCNPDCEFYYHVLFEHFRCKKDKKQNKKHWSEDPKTEMHCQKCGTVWKLGESISCPKCEESDGGIE